MNPHLLPRAPAHNIATLFAPILQRVFPPGTTFITHERTNIFASLPQDPGSAVFRSKVGQFMVDHGVVDAVLEAASTNDHGTVARVALYCAARFEAFTEASGTPYSTFRLRIDKHALVK